MPRGVAQSREVDISSIERQLARRDSALRKWLKTADECDLPRPRHSSHFETIVFAVLAQQVSAKAADTITLRLLGKLGGEATPAGVLTLGEEKLRTLGLTRAKTRTLLELAQAITAGELDLDSFADLSDVQVQQTLTSFRGDWSLDRGNVAAISPRSARCMAKW